MKGFLLLSGLLLASPAWAQKVTVKRVKGNQAVVQVSGGTLEVGQTYNLGAGGDEFESTVTPRTRGGGPRNNILGFSAVLSSLKSDSNGASNSVTNWGGDVRYGWNKVNTEYGLIASLASSDSGGGATMTFGGGGFFDFNLVPNRPGTSSVYGVGIDGQYLITNLPNGAGSTNTMRFFPSGFYKWYPLGNSVALRFDAGYLYSDASAGNFKTKVSGISVNGGLSVYF